MANDDEHILKGEEIAIMEELMVNSDQIQKEGNNQETKEQLKSGLKVRKNEIHFEEDVNYMDEELVMEVCESDEEIEVEKKIYYFPSRCRDSKKS